MRERETAVTVSQNEFSEKFALQTEPGFIILTITNPWQEADDQGFTWILDKGTGNLPDSLKKFPVIKVPVKNVVVFSTTHIGFISALHEENTITGVSGFKYVYNRDVRKRIAEGLIKDVGYPPAIDFETIISLHPDVVFLYGLNASVSGISQRLLNAGIPSVIMAEYLEKHPLGKMEWLKVFAAFYGREKLASNLFSKACDDYMKLQKRVETVLPKPKVLAGLPWKDTWYMAGGKSFMAKLIEDAGGDYIWKTDPSDEYIPLDLETVFMKAYHADCWINPGSVRSLGEISARDERFASLPVFQKGRVYNNDARLNDSGGNDYWESGVVSPEIILADLVKIFHPELMNQHEFVYYRKLE